MKKAKIHEVTKAISFLCLTYLKVISTFSNTFYILKVKYNSHNTCGRIIDQDLFIGQHTLPI